MNRPFSILVLAAGISCFPVWTALAQATNAPETKPRDPIADRREFMERHRDELRNLPPEERQAKLRELRRKEMAAHPELRPLTPEERLAKRKELRERMQTQLGALRKKKTDGTLDAFEKRRLERMEEVARRFEQASVRAGPTNSPATPGKNDLEK